MAGFVSFMVKYFAFLRVLRGKSFFAFLRVLRVLRGEFRKTYLTLSMISENLQKPPDIIYNHKHHQCQ